MILDLQFVMLTKSISRRKVGKGGVALMWHKAYNDFVTPLDIDNDRICGIWYRFNERLFIYILQVYAPCSNHSVYTYRRVWMGFIDYWLMALFLLTTDFWPKILLTADFSAVEFND